MSRWGWGIHTKYRRMRRSETAKTYLVLRAQPRDTLPAKEFRYHVVWSSPASKMSDNEDVSLTEMEERMEARLIERVMKKVTEQLQGLEKEPSKEGQCKGWP